MGPYPEDGSKAVNQKKRQAPEPAAILTAQLGGEALSCHKDDDPTNRLTRQVSFRLHVILAEGPRLVLWSPECGTWSLPGGAGLA